MRKIETEDIERFDRIPGAIRVSKTEIVHIEDLITKVAIANVFIGLMSDRMDYLEAVAAREGLLVHSMDTWAVNGVTDDLDAVLDALKCGLYGYEDDLRYQ